MAQRGITEEMILVLDCHGQGTIEENRSAGGYSREKEERESKPNGKKEKGLLVLSDHFWPAYIVIMLPR